MKAILEIKFEKIAGQKVTKELAKKPLISSTDKTIKRLCVELEKYFKKKYIETTITYKIKNGK